VDLVSTAFKDIAIEEIEPVFMSVDVVTFDPSKLLYVAASFGRGKGDSLTYVHVFVFRETSVT
jgi:hypothetical protein